MYLNKVTACALTFFCLASPQAFSAITYDILPRDGNFSPWSLDGGFITTDGTIGDVSPQNFESWELRFSSPSGESEISSDDGGAFLIITNSAFDLFTPSLSATADQLIANPDGGGILFLIFAMQDILSDDFTGNAVAFVPITGLVNNGGGGAVGLLIDNTVDNSNPIGLFTTVNSPNQSTFAVPSGPLVIGSVASVPEPSSLLLLVVSCSCLWFQARKRSGLSPKLSGVASPDFRAVLRCLKVPRAANSTGVPGVNR